jgi:hypothetical protein
MNAIIFIDTNIFLDFYRVRSSGVGLELLKVINSHHDVIITSSQVEMEYKKNRQRVVLDALNAQKTPDWAGLAMPPFLIDTTPAKAIAKARDQIKEQQGRVKKRIATLLDRPSATDAVYQTLQRLFKNSSPYNLNRDRRERFAIRNLARKRFVLGYPPRKSNDNSIGDAVNWEWIIHCANESGKNIIVVTRDGDYGLSYDKKYYINDWLRQEFSERVSQTRKIVLTDRLAEAFKLVAIPVSAEAEKEEKELRKNVIASFVIPYEFTMDLDHQSPKDKIKGSSTDC